MLVLSAFTTLAMIPAATGRLTGHVLTAEALFFSLASSRVSGFSPRSLDTGRRASLEGSSARGNH
jgi:hypothetical protein